MYHYFLKVYKTIMFVPIVKKGYQKLPGNYGSISILSVVASVWENSSRRIISFHGHFYFFIKTSFDSYVVLQFGCVIRCNIWIKNCLSENRSVAGIFDDITKAFDYVCHKTLLSIWGVRRVMFRRFHCCLLNRKQHFLVGSGLSEPLIMRSGVPQGSIHGAIYF